MIRIDINADVGELPELIADGTQESLLRHLTSVNVACGGHAGNDESMQATGEQARRYGVSIGAHPSYPDRANFGRVEIEISAEALAESIARQLDTLGRYVEIRHVKPHGALYNSAANNALLARTIANGVGRFSRNVILVGLAGSRMIEVFRDAGFVSAAEAFADRRYETDGTLRPRRYADSLIEDPAEAALQAIRMSRDGFVRAWDGSEFAVKAETVCIHSDTPGAVRIAEAVRRGLEEAGLVVEHL